MLAAAAHKLVRSPELTDATSEHPKKTWTLGEKRKIIIANAIAIEEAHTAMQHPYQDEKHMDNFAVPFTQIANVRDMVDVLVLAGDVAWEEGKQKAAVTRYLDAITIGRRVPRGSVRIKRVMGITCESIGRRALWEHLGEMDATTAAFAATQLEALVPEHLPYAVTLEEEKYNTLHWINYNLEHPVKLTSKNWLRNKNLERSFYGGVVPRVYIINTMSSYVDKVIAQSRKPYMQDHTEIPVPKEMFTKAFAPPLIHGRVLTLTNEAADALLRTALALRVYQLRNGKYPNDLRDLVAAKFIKEVPGDPYAMPGTPLRYKPLSDNKYLLYSIGPDGVDDTGNGVENAKDVSRVMRAVNKDSKGDMVAGWYPY